MYLSDVDLQQAIKDGDLIVHPLPAKVGPTSIDLHLDSVTEAKIWDMNKLAAHNESHGHPPRELHVARMTYGHISREYLISPPRENDATTDDLVFLREDAVIIRPRGFVVWQTKEEVGTPDEGAKYICFIDGKSTRSRTGLVVHLTAPTIHAGWVGNVTLEMTNCGPLDLVLHAGDAVAQITVAQITQPPALDVKLHEAATYGQKSVSGAAPEPLPSN